MKLVGLLPLLKYVSADLSIMQGNFNELFANVTGFRGAAGEDRHKAGPYRKTPKNSDSFQKNSN